MFAVGWRIWAWIKLVKVWASLRKSDVQAIIPQELCLIDGLPNNDTEKDEDLGAQSASLKSYLSALVRGPTSPNRKGMAPLITGWRATGMLW